MGKSVKPKPPTQAAVEQDLAAEAIRRLGADPALLKSREDLLYESLVTLWRNHKGKKRPTVTRAAELAGIPHGSTRDILNKLVRDGRVIRLPSGVSIPVVK